MTQVPPPAQQLTGAQQLGQAPTARTINFPEPVPVSQAQNVAALLDFGSTGSHDAGTPLTITPSDPVWHMAQMMGIMLAGKTSEPQQRLRPQHSGFGSEELQSVLSGDQAAAATDTTTGATPPSGQSAGPAFDMNAPVGSITADAQKYLGIPYLYNGSDPKVGLDCSGFVQRVFADVGINLPRSTYQMVGVGQQIMDRNQLRPGDLIFFWGDKGNRPNGHVGIYVGGNTMINAPHTGAVVRYDTINWDRMTQMRRM